MKCPKCGKEMEHGFLNLPSMENLEWHDRKNEMSMLPRDLKIDILIEPSPWNGYQIEGDRCIEDQILVLEYGQIYYPISGKFKPSRSSMH
jgi:hypothetical protein